MFDSACTATEVPFRFFATGDGVFDGYQDVAPDPALPLAIRATRPQDNPDIFVSPVALAAGKVTAVWLIGLVGGTGPQALGYFVCDEISAADGGTTTCHRQ